jgi:hypothetical protein
MKYFTPQRYLRLGNLDNREAFLKANEEWERALDDYQRHFRRVRRLLPKDFGQLLDTLSLHDARILDMWWGGRRRFTITLLPESDPSRLVVLTYSLVQPPEVEQDVLPASVQTKPVAWLYDELEVKSHRRGNPLFFSHNILLSDGREIRINFRTVTVIRPLPLVPENPKIDTSATVIPYCA